MLKRRTMPALRLAVNILPVLSLILARGATLRREVDYAEFRPGLVAFYSGPAAQTNRGWQRK